MGRIGRQELLPLGSFAVIATSRQRSSHGLVPCYWPSESVLSRVSHSALTVSSELGQGSTPTLGHTWLIGVSYRMWRRGRKGNDFSEHFLLQIRKAPREREGSKNKRGGQACLTFRNVWLQPPVATNFLKGLFWLFIGVWWLIL